MSFTKDIKRMLKDHGISEIEYQNVREKSKLDNIMYDELALEYNAPLGITWKKLAKRYQKEYEDSGQMADEYLFRMIEKYLEGKYEGDENAFALEFEQGLNKYRKKAQTRKPTGESNKSKEKKVKLRKLYHRYKEKGHSQKETHNILRAKHFPEWSIETIKSYLK